MANIVIVTGSPTPSSRTLGIATHLKESLIGQGHQVDEIDVRELPPADLVFASFDSPAIKQTHKLVDAADAVIVITPVYKAAYTGLLKIFLDLMPQNALEGKVVWPLAIGGTLTHLLMIDYALKPVLSTLGAEHIIKGVYILDTQVKWHEQGKVYLAEEVEKRIEKSLNDFSQAIASHRQVVYK
jgi:FMN reductase